MTELLKNPWLLTALVIWTVSWKGWALWRSARQGQKIWFLVWLIVNTLGILEILYLFVFSKKPTSSLVKSPSV